MKGAPWHYGLVLGLIALGTCAGILAWSRIEVLDSENQSLRARIAELSATSAESGEVERLRRENQEIPRLREERKELPKLRGGYQELLRLRRDYAALEARLGPLPASTGLTESASTDATPPALPNQGARLGISIAEVSERRASNPALNLPDGIMVTQVLPNTPAAQAGLAASLSGSARPQ